MPPADVEMVYQFLELSPEVRDRIRDRRMRYGWDRDRQQDGGYLKSLEALAEHFGGRVSDYSIDWSDYSQSYAKFDMPEDYQFIDDISLAEDENGDLDETKLNDLRRQEIKRRLIELGKYNPETLEGYGDCKLTGWVFDESAIDGFRKAFVKGETDLDKLMRAAFKSLHAAAKAEYEYDFSDEGIADDCEANELWFDEDGKIVEGPDPGKGRFSKDALARRETNKRMLRPHGRCSAGVCVEHDANKNRPRCLLGRQPKPKKGRSGQ